MLPSVLAGSPAQAHVGGQTANFADVGARVNERLPVLIAAVLAMSFVLLMLVFRSVLVPLKAVVLNLLSIGAAYGVMVMVFQWGWAAGLIGLESTVPIVSFIPMFMFAILFGLSMDYEVFLLSRVREEYVATRRQRRRRSCSGIASTGRVITSAALIMISVFLAFVLGADPATKMFGLGLATAIFVDATLVRMVLVPATMTLLGDANWWLPRALDRRNLGLQPSADDLQGPAHQGKLLPAGSLEHRGERLDPAAAGPLEDVSAGGRGADQDRAAVGGHRLATGQSVRLQRVHDAGDGRPSDLLGPGQLAHGARTGVDQHGQQ